jgi:hypothetical protein
VRAYRNPLTSRSIAILRACLKSVFGRFRQSQIPEDGCTLLGPPKILASSSETRHETLLEFSLLALPESKITNKASSTRSSNDLGEIVEDVF